MKFTKEQILKRFENINYEFAKILDVEIDNCKINVVCQCECGNIFKKKPFQMKSTTVNCGCKKSFLLSRAVRNKIASDPTYLKRRGESYSRWCKEHPEEVAAQGKRRSEMLQANPDKLVEQGKRHSQWYKDHPEYVAELKEKSAQWYKDNPDKVIERSKKYSRWCKEHPEEVANKSKKYIKWCESDIEGNLKRGKTISNKKKMQRIKMLEMFSDDELSKVHPDDLKSIFNGDLRGNCHIRLKCPMCGEYDYHRFDLSFSLRDKVIINRLCDKCESDGKSHYESEIYDFITSLGYSCVRNTREIISPLELDLYIPNKNLAIEFNGNYWHSELYKNKDYHYNKFKLCRERGINLISIFENEWIFDSNVIKDYIKDYLNGIENNISFNEDHSIMNNDYPSPKEYILGEFVENYYSNENYKVYTCGFSKIME